MGAKMEKQSPALGDLTLGTSWSSSTFKAGLNSHHTTNLGQAKGTKPMAQWVARWPQGCIRHTTSAQPSLFLELLQSFQMGKKRVQALPWGRGGEGSRKWHRGRRGRLNCSASGTKALSHWNCSTPAAGFPDPPLCVQELHCPQQMQPNLQLDLSEGGWVARTGKPILQLHQPPSQKKKKSSQHRRGRI